MKFMLCFSFTILLGIPVLANDKNASKVTEDNIFNITSGIEDSDEITFDNYRTITGIAKEGTIIEITNILNSEEEKNYKIEVGSSGVFSIDIELFTGYNNIEIKATEDKTTQNIKQSIRKLDQNVKEKISSKELVLPGDSILMQ